MLNIGPQELLVILLIALIVVGPQRLPELSRQIGKGLREFKKVQDDVKDMVKFDLDPEPEKPTRKPASPTAPGVHRTPRPAPPATTPVEEVRSAGAAADVASTNGAATSADPGTTPDLPSEGDGGPSDPRSAG
jgi:sec-independent protein translocase protein TatB